MATTVYNKLVRDKIPDILSAKGISFATRQLTSKEYYSALMEKLQEECAEFVAKPSITELADISEVLLALVQCLDSSAEELERVRTDKAQERGTFRKKIYLEYTTEN